MNADPSLDPGARGSRALWLSAAYEVLLESGVEAVRIQPLGKRVGLSRTSFYWAFADREALLAALLDLWRNKNTGGLVGQAGAYAESVTEAVLNCFDCWLDPALFDPQFEFAVRSWALQSEGVAGEIARADADRLAALAALFVRFGFPALEADVRARTVYLTQIGYISMKSREPLGLRLARIPDYVRIFAGREAAPRELARFRARHAAGAAPATPDGRVA